MAKKKSYYSRAEFKLLPKEVKNKEFRELTYDFAQNLKMPFLNYIQRPRQILLGIFFFIITYIYVEPSDGIMDFTVLFMKFYIPSVMGLYKFVDNYNYEDMLLNPDDK